jgi:hypothetical protein
MHSYTRHWKFSCHIMLRPCSPVVNCFQYKFGRRLIGYETLLGMSPNAIHFYSFVTIVYYAAWVCWVSGLCASSDILKEHNVSETRCIPVLKLIGWGGGECAQIAPLEGAVLNYWSSVGSVWTTRVSYSAVTIYWNFNYGNLKQCDTRILTNYHFMREVWNNAIPPPPAQRKNRQELRMFQNLSWTYVKSSGPHPRVKCDRTVFNRDRPAHMSFLYW